LNFIKIKKKDYCSHPLKNAFKFKRRTWKKVGIKVKSLGQTFLHLFLLHQFANHSLNQLDIELLIFDDFTYVNGLGMFPTWQKKPKLYDGHEIIMTN
jgi:hypothetical protein